MINFFQKVLDFFKHKKQREEVQEKSVKNKTKQINKIEEFLVYGITTKKTKTGIEFYYLYKMIYKSNSKKTVKAWRDFENSFLKSHKAKKILKDIHKIYDIW